MEPRIHVIMLAVDDLERVLAFYRDGLVSTRPASSEPSSATTTPAPPAPSPCSTFRVGSSSPFTRARAAEDAGVPFSPPKSGEFSIGHAVVSRADVDVTLARAETAGATVLDKPHD